MIWMHQEEHMLSPDTKKSHRQMMLMKYEDIDNGRYVNSHIINSGQSTTIASRSGLDYAVSMCDWQDWPQGINVERSMSNTHRSWSVSQSRLGELISVLDVRTLP